MNRVPIPVLAAVSTPGTAGSLHWSATVRMNAGRRFRRESRSAFGDTFARNAVHIYKIPLSALELRGHPGDETIALDWTVNTTLPVTTTWHIDYYTQTAGVYTATDPLSITRAYTLTDHVINYQWYTATLHAMVGGTSWLSDTVRVMPTDLFMYLPVVMKED